MKKMLTIFLFIGLLLFTLVTDAQISINLKGIMTSKVPNSYMRGSIGDSIRVTNVHHEFGNVYFTGIVNHYMIDVPIKFIDAITFDFENLNEFWKVQAVKNETLANIAENGYQYELRKELEDEVLEYISNLESANLLYEDPYLESYLYSLIKELFPSESTFDRNSNFNILILKDVTPNAFIAPNGSLFITTGLLSTLRTKEELRAVLAHEVAHFVLDHSIININKDAQRVKRAEFWTGVATGIAAITEGYIASQNDSYIPGDLTIGTAVLSYTIAHEVLERLGNNYSKEQEILADECTIELLEFLNYNKNALASALERIKSTLILNGNYMAFSDVGSHPDIRTRIMKAGVPNLLVENQYDVIFSDIISYDARVAYRTKHFSTCEILLDRNINSNVESEYDLLLKVMVILYLYEDKNKFDLALTLIEKSITINPNIEGIANKQKALVLSRLGQNDSAIISLNKYIYALESNLSQLNSIKNETLWLNLYNYNNNEIEWARGLIRKLAKLE